MKTKKQSERGEFEGVVTLLVLFALGIIVGLFWIWPIYRVWQQGMEGKAMLSHANQQREILVTQARAEKEAAQLRADAIGIVGKAAQEFPQYRQQEFIGAFAEALQNGKINQIIYVPTEANIPIIEAGKR